MNLHVYLSPHLDDAVFSCGGAMAAQRARGARVIVVTICAGVPPSDTPQSSVMSAFPGAVLRAPDHTMRLRRDEDRLAMNYLDLEYEWHDALDAMYRMPRRYSGLLDLVGPIAEDDPLVPWCAALVDRLPPDAQLHAPLGAGGHVDHRIVCDAARRSGRDVLLYEDFPYAVFDPPAVQRRLEELGGGFEPVLTDIGATLDARVRASARYTSQIAGSWDLRGLVSTHAASAGAPYPAERAYARRKPRSD